MNNITKNALEESLKKISPSEASGQDHHQRPDYRLRN